MSHNIAFLEAKSEIKMAALEINKQMYQMFESDSFGNLVGKLCFSHYDKLSKTGKPQKGKEWTHLAAILVSKYTDQSDLDLKVVSMGTGTKCVGLSARNKIGYVLHDSHAEVLSRRAFLRYIYFEIGQAVKDNSSTIFNYKSTIKTCSLKPNVDFHMFVSHTPCGDASIFPKTPFIDDEIGVTIGENMGSPKSKRKKLETDDIERTGAKCLSTGPQDPHLPGVNYHITKAIRIKPGRGEATRSLSCSDKIAKWNVLGLQGALLLSFLNRPIYLTTFIVANCPFNKSSLHRAIIDRIKDVADLPSGFRVHNPNLLQSNLCFEDGRFKMSQMKNDFVPCPSAIIWCGVPEKLFDVTVQGKKQGITKKTGLTEKAACFVSKKKLFDQFHILKRAILTDDELKDNFRSGNLRTYYDWKTSISHYQKAKSRLRNVLTDWPPTLSIYEQFTNGDPNT